VNPDAVPRRSTDCPTRITALGGEIETETAEEDDRSDPPQANMTLRAMIPRIVLIRSMTIVPSVGGSQQNGPHSMAISSSDLDQRLLREPNRMPMPQAMRGRTCQFPEDGNCAIDGVNRASTQLRCSNDTSA